MALFNAKSTERSHSTRRMARSILVVATVAVVTFAVTGSRSGLGATVSLPTAPQYVSATPGNTSALVRWTAPTSNGGSAITNYVVTPYAGTTALAKRVVGNVTETSIAGLTNKKAYTFRVAATNANGTGPQRATAAITVGTPVPPKDVYAMPGADSSGGATMTVHWTNRSANGSAITAYVVTTYENGVAKVSHVYPAPASAATVAALTYGKTYTFRVVAGNARGAGPGSVASAGLVATCVGTKMPNGQSDINAAPGGTTFCLAGTHNWTLTPKSGDKLIGPAVLDGAHTTAFAILGNGTSNVVLSALEVRNYHVTDPDAAIAGHGTTGWFFRDLRVHDNGTIGNGGTGADLGVSSKVVGGRYYNNRELGIGGGGGANGWVITGAEIDHNNFTNNTYSTRNVSCGYQAGGVKWTADNTTIQHSKVHDNACKGLWVDLNGDNTKILDNNVYGNWDEGIFIEISSGATVTGNTVTGNGLRNYNGDGSGCPWLWGGGITLASSDHAVIANNTVSGNCNGITGTQQTRADGHPGLLEYENIHDNTIVGPGGKTGAVADNGANLSSRSIVFAKNTIKNHTFCALAC
jgi:parallel beta-helix repeat protein